MCEIPCWPTPEEANKLLKLGYGHQLCLDHYYNHNYGPMVWALAPRRIPNKRETPKDLRKYGPGLSGCCLQTKEGLCSIHNICKPIEGRLASSHINLEDEGHNLRYSVGKMWMTAYGDSIYQRWLVNPTPITKMLRTKGKLPQALYYPHLRGVGTGSVVKVKINSRWVKTIVFDTPNARSPNHYLLEPIKGYEFLIVTPSNIQKVD